MADVTRHGKDAPSGVMETIIYEAFQVFKEEGIGYGSLGVAPLAGLSAESKIRWNVFCSLSMTT